MDPTTTLDELRALVETATNPRSTVNLPESRAADLFFDMAWLVKDLDQWISRGGFLPTQWKDPKITSSSTP